MWIEILIVGAIFLAIFSAPFVLLSFVLYNLYQVLKELPKPRLQSFLGCRGLLTSNGMSPKGVKHLVRFWILTAGVLGTAFILLALIGMLSGGDPFDPPYGSKQRTYPI
jgi:hypothetical protein